MLVSPEIIVSLDGLTVHLFDRATGFSITPTGHCKTGANIADTWFYTARRTNPGY